MEQDLMCRCRGTRFADEPVRPEEQKCGESATQEDGLCDDCRHGSGCCCEDHATWSDSEACKARDRYELMIQAEEYVGRLGKEE